MKKINSFLSPELLKIKIIAIISAKNLINLNFILTFLSISQAYLKHQLVLIHDIYFI